MSRLLKPKRQNIIGKIPSKKRMFDIHVVSNQEVAKDIYALHVKAPEVVNDILPGQFLNIKVPGDKSEILRLPFAYSSANTNLEQIEILYEVVGAGTYRLSKVKKGDTLNVLAPLGHGWNLDKATCAKKVLLISGGMGIAPILSLAYELFLNDTQYEVVLGFPSANKLFGTDSFKELGANKVHITTDDGSEGHHGFSTDIAIPLIASHSFDYVATCGPEPMTKKIAEAAIKNDIYCEASLEKGMICGFGVCASCVIKTTDGGRAGVCSAGPVFDVRKVVWNE